MKDIRDFKGDLHTEEDRFILDMNVSDHITVSDGELVKLDGKIYKIIQIIPLDPYNERYEIIGKRMTTLEFLEHEDELNDFRNEYWNGDK
jgi:hypothetical protein